MPKIAKKKIASGKVAAKKKATPKKKAVAKKKAAPKKAQPKKKAAPKKVAPKKKAVAKKKAAPKKVVPKKKAVAKKKAAPKKKATPKKTAPKKAAPKKTTQKKKAPAKKAAPRKAAPKKRSATIKRKITEVLLNQKKQILNEVADMVKSESNTQKFEIGDIYDIASIERERELTLILGDRDREKLSGIEAALERLSDGSYGECEECGEPIADQRLVALPFTRVCVECKSKHERQQGFLSRYEEEGGMGGILDRTVADEED